MSQRTWVVPLDNRDHSDPDRASTPHDQERPPTLGRSAVLLVGVLGLLFAFAGSAGAASLITGRNIKDGTIASVDLRDGRLQGVDIRDGSLTRTDFGKLPTGAEGPQGGQGLAGADGVQGVRRRQESRNLLSGEFIFVTVQCPPDSTQVVGGGLSSDRPQDLYIFESAPATSGWQVKAENIGGGLITATAVAVCVQ
jgi:hypothetical protein